MAIPKTEPKALRAAKKMMKERGYVVVGIAPGKLPPTLRGLLDNLGGHTLGDDHVLRVDRPTTQADWKHKFQALFGPSAIDPNTPEFRRDGTFWRTTLLRLVEEI